MQLFVTVLSISHASILEVGSIDGGNDGRSAHVFGWDPDFPSAEDPVEGTLNFHAFHHHQARGGRGAFAPGRQREGCQKRVAPAKGATNTTFGPRCQKPWRRH
jgi:hypothetical protein